MASTENIATMTYPVSGIPDSKGVSELIRHMKAADGVKEVSFDEENRLLKVAFNPKEAEEHTIKNIIDQFGHAIFRPEEPITIKEPISIK